MGMEKQGRRVDVAFFTPIKPRMRDDDFRPADEQRQKAMATTQWVTRTVALCRIAAAGTVAAVAAEEGLDSDV